MPVPSNARLVRLLAASAFLIGTAAGDAHTANFTWTNTSICLFGGCNWSSASFWSPARVSCVRERASVLGAMNGV